MEGIKHGGPHPTREELERFVRNELPREQALGLVRHLLTKCPDCTQVTRRLWRFGEWPPSVRANLEELAAVVRPRRAHDEPGLI
jgi:hypothetical protein